MQIIENTISKAELIQMSKKMFDSLVKAVVDVEKNILVVDAELHSDQEQFLIEQGSEQKNLWGINLYPEKTGRAWLEFDSMINLKAWAGNKTRGVDDPKIRKQIAEIIKQKVK